MLPPMQAVVSFLSRFPALRQAARILRLHLLANAFLRRYPRVRHLPVSGIRYRATRLESIPLAQEMFEKGALYDAALLPTNFTTFADLGCNVGYFTCWLAHLARGRTLKGLMLDANPYAVADAQWHAEANGMHEVFAIHGIVGEGSGGSADFYLYESNICSTSEVPDVEKMGLKGKWEKISVPHVSVAGHWRRHFNDTRCHVLKIDVEGSEMNFLRAEEDFLDLVDSIIVEWHKWRVTLTDLRKFLEPRGFRYVKTVEENEQMGTAVFSRPAIISG
jgi:FkbM family methyltransferase